MNEINTRDLKLSENRLRTQTKSSSLSASSIEAAIINKYYLILIAAYFTSVFTPLRPAVLMFCCNMILIFLRIVSKDANIKLRVSAVSLLVIWCMLSLISYSTNSLPISVYINALTYVCTPIICCVSIANIKTDYTLFYRNFLIAIVINNIFGVICFYAKPGFYVNFISRTSESAYAQLFNIGGAGRLVTLFGSIETGVLSVIGLIIALGMIINGKRNKGYVFSLVVCLATIVLTQQRGPLLTSFFIILFIVIYSLHKQLIKPKLIVLLIITIIVVLYILYVNKPVVFTWIIERLLNPTDALSERSTPFLTAIQDYSVMNFIFGRGFGACEMFAKGYTPDLLYDGLYFNAIGEIGIIGFLLYVFIILKSLFKRIKNIKMYFSPIFIVFTIAFIGLGTTLTYYPQIMPVFWFSVGLINHNRLTPKKS